MVRALLIRGMLVGFLAGLLVFGFAKVFGEPQVDRAIAFETAMDEAKMKADLAKGIHDEEEPALVSRWVQASFGLFTGVVVYATAFGGLFALVFAFAYGRVGALGPRALSALLALAGFICLYLVPSLKYPADPPAVGDPDTIGMRTALYFTMMASSVAAMAGALFLRERLSHKRDAWSAALLASGAYLAAVIVAAALLPVVNEVPNDFPAVVLWRFRIDSLAMQAIMWTTFGLVFGALIEKTSIGRLHRLGGRPAATWR
ncbi:MAG TPA: CbtA family protein [Alphaproteobacteria bacterium]|nr:CbtA family protein [Alphaproteobacteria bacterium]